MAVAASASSPPRSRPILASSPAGSIGAEDIPPEVSVIAVKIAGVSGDMSCVDTGPRAHAPAVLVVDPDDDQRRRLRDALDSRGVTVVEAGRLIDVSRAVSLDDLHLH